MFVPAASNLANLLSVPVIVISSEASVSHPEASVVSTDVPSKVKIVVFEGPADKPVNVKPVNEGVSKVGSLLFEHFDPSHIIRMRPDQYLK